LLGSLTWTTLSEVARRDSFVAGSSWGNRMILEAVLCPRGPFERSLNFCTHLFHGHQVPHPQQRVRQDLVALDQAW
jgi:hypothetical protein